MKKIFCFLTVFLILSSFSAAVYAQQYEYRLSAPEGFTEASPEGDMTQLAKIFDMKIPELKKYCREHNIIYLAANSENTCQITLSRSENSFSKGAVSFSRLSDGELDGIAKDLAGKKFTNKGIVTGKDKNKYICLAISRKDSGGPYTVTEYITVCSNKIYTLSISASDGKFKENMPSQILKGLDIYDAARIQNTNRNMTYTVFAILGIALFASVAVFFTITVIKDYKKSRNQN